MQLTISQKEQYHVRGWLVVKDIIPLAEVRSAARELDGVHEAAWELEQRTGRLPWGRAGASWEVTMGKDQPQRIEQLIHSDDVSPALARIGRSQPVIDILDQLMDPGQDIMLFHSKTLMRAGEAASRFPWHQDYGYWHYTHARPLHINCGVALEAQTRESGCLQYVDGSQTAGLLEHQMFEQKTVSSFPLGLSEQLDAYQGIHAEYEPGDAIFFGALVVHGSDVNRTGRAARFNTFAYDLSGNRKDAQVTDPLVRWGRDRVHAV